MFIELLLEFIHHSMCFLLLTHLIITKSKVGYWYYFSFVDEGLYGASKVLPLIGEEDYVHNWSMSLSKSLTPN